MNKKLVFIVMLICMMTFTAVSVFAQNSSGTVPERWEYLHVGGIGSIDSYIEKANQLGKEGWELLTWIVNGRANTLIFKRKLP